MKEVSRRTFGLQIRKTSYAIEEVVFELRCDLHMVAIAREPFDMGVVENLLNPIAHCTYKFESDLPDARSKCIQELTKILRYQTPIVFLENEPQSMTGETPSV